VRRLLAASTGLSRAKRGQLPKVFAEAVSANRPNRSRKVVILQVGAHVRIERRLRLDFLERSGKGNAP
jgi:hypothetical protein